MSSDFSTANRNRNESSDSPAGVGIVPNAPVIDEDGENKVKSVKDVDQALSICRSLRDDSDDRITTLGRVRSLADGVDPIYDPQSLFEAGKSWKSNINTGFLQNVIQRVVTRLVMRAKSAPHLTASRLPNDIPNAVEKTNYARRLVTQAIRSWRQWHWSLYGMAYETCIGGYCFSAYTDPYEWRPRVFRLDKAFIPNGTEQGDENIPYFAILDEYTPDELFEFIEDRDIAKDVGFDVDNVVEAIAAAHPQYNSRSGNEEDDVVYEDLKREMIKGNSFEEGANVAPVWHFFTTEHDGSVNQWMISEETGETLFYAEGRYDSMEDTVVPFTYEYGNGKIHGSHGMGHLLYDLAMHVEKTRNTTIDALRMRQKFHIQAEDEGDLSRVKHHIVDHATYLSGGTFMGHQASLPATGEESMSLDNALARMAEQKVGAFMPEALTSGESATATEANINALKEQETKEAVLDHFLTNLSRLMRVIQMRLLDPSTRDPVAQQLQENLAEKLTPEEIEIFKESAPIHTTIDLTESQNAKRGQYLMAMKQNPNYDQAKIDMVVGAMALGVELNEELMIPQDDPSVISEQARQQQLENTTMRSGEQVPVSSRDNHDIHKQQLRGQPDPESGEFTGPLPLSIMNGDIQAGAMLLDHYKGHVDAQQKAGTAGEGLNEDKKFIAEMDRRLNNVAEQMKQAAEGGGGLQ